MSDTLSSVLTSGETGNENESVAESLIKRALLPSQTTGLPSLLTPSLPAPNVFFSGRK